MLRKISNDGLKIKENQKFTKYKNKSHLCVLPNKI